MKTLHTKGQWIVTHSGGQVEKSGIPVSSKNVICVLETAPLKITEEVCANARLIAAAPELLEACIWAKEQFQILADKGLYPEHLLSDFGGDGVMPLVNAIKKATE